MLDIFTEGKGDDARVLKAQLDLAAQSVRTTYLTSPFWALALALLCSDLTGIFGHRPLTVTLYLPLILLAAMLLIGATTAAYRREMASDPEGNLRTWSVRLWTVQLALSAAWGTMPWLLWDPGNAVNHLFLATCCHGGRLAFERGQGQQHGACSSPAWCRSR